MFNLRFNSRSDTYICGPLWRVGPALRGRGGWDPPYAAVAGGTRPTRL